MRTAIDVLAHLSSGRWQRSVGALLRLVSYKVNVAPACAGHGRWCRAIETRPAGSPIQPNAPRVMRSRGGKCRGAYRIYRMFGRPIFAAPAKPRQLRLAGIARYQPFTPKRAIYRRLMHLSMLAGLDRLFCTTADSPLDPAAGFDFAQWMDVVREHCKDPSANGVVFWPPQRDRGRIYVHLFGRDLKPIGFAKISLDARNDRCLRREAQSLRELQSRGLKKCHIPEVLSLGQIDGHTYLIIEPIPETARPIESRTAATLAQCMAEYSGTPRRAPAAELPQLRWWIDYEHSLRDDCSAFAGELRSLLDHGVDLCRVHGDFGTGNIVRDDRQLWIFDWEQSRPDGPVLADEVGFFLATNFARNLADPRLALQLFEDRFLRDVTPQRRADVMLALAFRQGLGVQDAKLLLRHWGQLHHRTPRLQTKGNGNGVRTQPQLRHAVAAAVP